MSDDIITPLPSTFLDVMLAVGDTGDVPDDAPTPRAVHFEMLVDIGDGIAIGPLPNGVSEAVLDALERCGENMPHAYRQYGSLYALQRSAAPEVDSPRSIDPDRKLQRAAAILRLVRPHAMSLGDSARIGTDASGKRVIIPNSAVGPGSAAFVVNAGDRWIRDEDASATKPLLERYVSDEDLIPSRVGSALYAHEMAHWQRTGNERWPIIARALEGLVHTNDWGRPSSMGSQDQFVERMSKLRSFIPEIAFTDPELREIYRHRSHTMHGGHFADLWEAPGFSAQYAAAEDTLRVIVRRAILQPEIRAIFVSDESIRSHLGFRGCPPKNAGASP